MAKLIWSTPKIPKIDIPNWRPLVLVSCAVSIDGKLATISGDSRLSSFEDKVEVHKLRSEVDAILVGINTVLADDPHLTVSEKYYKSDRNPIRVVLDSKARIPLTSQVLTRKPEVPRVIATTTKADKGKINKLRKLGADVVTFEKNGKVDLIKLLKYLKEKYGVKTLMVEGGGKVISAFFKHGLVDKMRISINPYIFGGLKAVSMVENFGFRTVDEAPKFELVRIEKAGWSLIIHLSLIHI